MHIKEKLKQCPNGSVYTTKEVEGVYLIHKNNKIIVLSTLQDRVMEWYHTILVYSGEKFMEESVRSTYIWRGLQADTISYCKTYDTCQRCKRTRKKKY